MSETDKTQKAQAVKAQMSQNKTTQAPAAQKQAKSEVDENTYNRYTSLKFLEISGAKLKDEALKEIEELEKELKACSGKVSKKTVRAAINNEQVLLVEGMPITKNIENLIVDNGHSDYYLV